MSLRKTAISGLVWTFAQQFGVQGIQFLVSIFMARLLLPEEFGLIGMITVFISIGKSLMESGLTQSIIRTNNPDQEDYSTVFFFNLAGSILVYLILFFSAPLIASFYNQPILINIIRVYCFSFIITAFSAVQMTKLTKEMDFRTQMTITIPSLITSGLLGIFLAFHEYGVWSLVWMSLFQAFLSTVQLWWRTGWRPSLVFKIEKFKNHFQFGYKLTLSGLLDTIFKNIYQIIIGKFFVASQVGFYTRANSIKQLPVSNISSALNKVTYPLFASIQNDNERLKNVYKQIMQMVVFIVAPVLIIMGVLAEPLFRFLFTEKWLPAVPYFQILCLVGILYPINSYNLNVLKVKGRSDIFLKLEIIKKIIIVVIIIITLRFGIEGLIWGQLFSSIIALFINTYYTGKFIKYSISEQAKDILPIIGLAALAGVGVWGIDNIISNNSNSSVDFIRLIFGGFVGLSIFTSIAWLLKMATLQDFIKIVLRK